MPRLLIVALVVVAFSATAGESLAKDGVSLTGGVCADDPLTIIQTSERSTPHHFNFFDECKVLSTDNKAWFGVDQPPATFICPPSGGSLLSGATYRKVRNSIIKSTDDMLVDSRVYIYKCVKGCSRAPAEIEYEVDDCG